LPTPSQSPELAEQIDRLCDDFESAWKAAGPAGAAPPIEEYLANAPASEPDRAALLHELIQLDIYYRGRRGESARSDDYRARFPALDRVLLTDAPTNEPSSPGPPIPRRRVTGLPVIVGYEILEEVGRGGMGVVYRARQTALNRIVALKMILHTRHAGPEERARFKLEAEAVACLQHPNIVHIYEIGEHEEMPFISLEFCSGGSLARKVGDTPLPPREAAQLAETLARAMHAVHQVHVVHRDLKPDNVLLTADGTPKITDFGLAKRLDDESGENSPALTETGVILGTPSYMAPEQASGKVGEVGPRTDVYALAAILYQLLTGRPPFKSATRLDTLNQVLTEEPVPPRRLQPQIDRDVEIICLKGLEKDQRRRYPSAAELADDLHRFLSHEPIRARPVPAWERGLKWARRQPKTAALFVALFLAVLGALFGTSFYALYKNRVAEDLKRTLERGRKVDQLRDEAIKAEAAGRQLLEQGQETRAGEQFAQAASYFDQAEATLGLSGEGEADSADLRRQLSEGRERMRRALREQTNRQESRDRIARFFTEHSRICFQDINFRGQAGTDRGQIGPMVRGALDHLKITFPCSPESAVGVLQTWRGACAPREFEQLVVGCYELLLIWAEAEAGSQGPGEERAARAARALQLLDIAARLGEANHLPPSPTLHRRRARYLALAGDEGGARAEQKRAHALPPRTALDHFLVALDAYGAGQFPRVEKACEEVLRQKPDHFWAQYLLSLCHLKARHWGEARAGLIACVGRHPEFPWPYALLALARLELGETREAETNFARALERLDDPLGRYVVLTNRSTLWIRTQRWNEAQADLEEAIRLRPDKHEAYANLAELHRRRKEWDAAITDLTNAIVRRPGDPALYYTRARVGLERKDSASARADFEQTIKLESGGSKSARLVSALVELGYLKHRAGEFDAALADFETAEQLAPTYAPAHRQRAETLLALHRLAEAGKELDCCLKIGPPQFEVHKTRGLIHNQLGEYAPAVVAYTQALQLKPDREILCLRGWVYLQLRSATLALADFEEVLAHDLTHAEALSGRAQALVRLGKLEQALTDAEEAVQRGPATPRVLFSAACIHARAAGQIRGGERNVVAFTNSTRHADRAIDLLDLALREVPAQERPSFWRQHVEEEPLLGPIRSQSRMRQLARTYRP
jgi:tetratricopeptide (TPR) repeat protein/tRNA A-37 threonylcarbamoyl transferase component Bud32